MHKVIYTKRAQKALLKVPKDIGLRIREMLHDIRAYSASTWMISSLYKCMHAG